jgi:hypothetical protein
MVAIPPVSSALPHRAASGLRVRRRVDSVTGLSTPGLRAESVLTRRDHTAHLPAETDARSTTTQIYEGTNQIHRVVMARQLLK